MTKKINLVGLILLVILTVQSAVAQNPKPSNEGYNLISINDNGKVRLFKQYETTKTEVSYPEGIFENVGKDFPYRKQFEREKIIFNATPVMISWNGKYFLMDNSYSLIKYDGQKFEVIRYTEGLYSGYQIEKMISVRKYWLLIYSDKGTPNKIVRVFLGDDFKDFHVPAFYSPIWLFYILPVLVALFIYRLLRDLKKRKTDE